MLDGGDADRVGDEEGGDIDEAEETLVRLIAEHPEDDWLGHLESVLPAALAAARIVDAPPSFRLVESMHGLRGVTPISGAGVVLTTDTWLTGTECREIFPQASRIIEKAIRDRDASPEPESSTARSYLPPLGHIDARTAIDTAVRVRHAMGAPSGVEGALPTRRAPVPNDGSGALRCLRHTRPCDLVHRQGQVQAERFAGSA